jgi:hypothetical protein
VDEVGTVHELIRENQLLGDKVVKKFTVLTAVSGSEGVTRSFNATHEVVAHVTFTDGSSGIVKIEVP